MTDSDQTIKEIRATVSVQGDEGQQRNQLVQALDQIKQEVIEGFEGGCSGLFTHDGEVTWKITEVVRDD